MAYFKQPEYLTKEDIVKENIKSITLSVVIGVGLALLLFFQLSK